MAGAAGRRCACSPERDVSPDPSGPGARATSRTLTRFAPGGRARLHQPDYAFSLLGASPVPAKSLLATIALALAAVQVLLALWIYGKLPLPGPPAWLSPMPEEPAGEHSALKTSASGQPQSLPAQEPCHAGPASAARCCS